MTSFLTTSATYLTLSIFAAAGAFAQCPASVPDVLPNTNWAFHWESPDYNNQAITFIPGGGSAGIGTFTITRSAAGLNLAGVTTINASSQVTRLATTRGAVQYQCDATGLLRGATLQFADGRQGILWQAVFADRNYNEMYLVNEVYLDNIFLSHILKGNAVTVDKPSCPANANMVLGAAFAPNGWSFQSQDATFNFATLAGQIRSFMSGTAAVGYLNFVPNGDSRNGGPNLSGVITANHSVQASGVPGSSFVRLADTYGRYQVYPDCSGGTFSVMVGQLAVNYEFVFAANGFSQLFLLSTNATATGTSASNPKTATLNGLMKRF